MAKQHEYVLRTVEERGIRLVRLWFTDVLGYLKSFAITPAELETAFSEGMQFDGSAMMASPGSRKQTCSPTRTPQRFRSSRGVTTRPGWEGCSAG
jgi:glutamine synthetase